MAHDVFGLEMRKADARYVLEHFDDMVEPGFGAFRQVDLGNVTGNHGGGAEADAGQEHLHLLDGGVLALVEDDEAVVQRPAAHISQRRDFDDLALNELGHVFKAEHLVQGVI